MTEEQEIEFIEDEENELTTYSYISNGLYFEYFVGYEVATLLGYKNPKNIITNNVSKSNKLEFRDYPGIKNPELDPRVILISRDGAIEILLKTRKRISPDVLHILKKFNIDTTNRKCLTKEQQTLSTITNVFKTEKFEDQHKIGTYYLDLYFSDYKIVIECDENGHADRKPWKERARMDYVNEKLEINDSHWIRFNPDEHDFDIAKVIGRIYRKIDEIKEQEKLKILQKQQNEYNLLLEEERKKPKEDDNINLKDLNVYSYINNNIEVEYFVSTEISEMLGYRAPTDMLKLFVSLPNKIKFKEFLGEKNPKINGNITLVTRQGVVEILSQTRKKMSSDILRLFKKYKFDIVIKSNKKKVEDIKGKIEEEVKEEDTEEVINGNITELNKYSYVNTDNVLMEYFIGNEITKILGHKNSGPVYNLISQSNKLEFCNFPGEKIPKLHPSAILINKYGVKELILKSRKYLSVFTLDMLKRSKIHVKIDNNKKTVNFLEEEDIEEEVISNASNSDIIDNIKTALATEKMIEQYEVKDKYKVELYFPEYKIVIDNNTDKERFLNINDTLKIDESFWIKYGNDIHPSSIIGQIYSLMKSKGKALYQVCAGCKISKELCDYHKNSYNPLRVEYYCKVCRSEQNKERLLKKKKSLENLEIKEKYCEKCDKTLPIINFWKSTCMSDGYYKYCKPCGTECRKIQKEDNKKEPDDLRKCVNCKIIKNKEEFAKNLNNYDGLTTICIPCRKEIKNKRDNENRKIASFLN